MADSEIRQRQIFEAAVEMPADQQEEYLALACDGDSELEQRVLRLLEAHLRETQLKSPIPAPRIETPDRIGPYRILEPIGEGGMGVVYIAEQTRPVRRRVALKVIKAGMETKEVIARFETERQALAMMNHPNIAGILDVGATELGRPYFVMEYVPGLPIVDYCDNMAMDVPARIGLFQGVCNAVQHAHQKGIIHRDLKPSNILVSEVDGRAVPKVIDFGIAKATGPRLGDRTLHTRLGSFMGTPEYMSPEQAEGAAIDVDTRADVYSLGAVLYELLAGAPPFVFERGMGPSEMQRVLFEVEPVAPSLRVYQAGEFAIRTARNRSSTVDSLARLLRGDLDWITLKALEKDRVRRYSAASELVADLRRYLDQEPVSAGPPGAGYRLSKFARRNRGPLLAALLVFIVLVGGIIGTGLGLIRSQAEAERADAARLEAESALGRSEAVRTFMTDLFVAGNPFEVSGQVVTTEDLLDQAVNRAASLETQPAVQAQILTDVATAYSVRGLQDKAEPLLHRALKLRRADLSDAHQQGLCTDDAHILDVHVGLAQALQGLGRVYHERGALSEAEALHRESLAVAREALDRPHLSIVKGLSNLSAVLVDMGDYGTAKALAMEGLDLQRQIDRNHGLMGELLYRQGSILRLEAAYANALPVLEESLEIFRALWDSDNGGTARSMGELATVYYHLGDYEAAEELLSESLAMKRRIFGANHIDVAADLRTAGLIYSSLGRLDEADEAARESIDIVEHLFGREHLWGAATLESLASVLTCKGDFEQAEEILFEVRGIKGRLAGEDHPGVGRTVTILAQLEESRGDMAAARAFYQEALDIFSVGLGDDHQLTRVARADLVRLEGLD